MGETFINKTGRVFAGKKREPFTRGNFYLVTDTKTHKHTVQPQSKGNEIQAFSTSQLVNFGICVDSFTCNTKNKAHFLIPQKKRECV